MYHCNFLNGDFPMTLFHGKKILTFVPVAVFVVTIILITGSGCVTSPKANAPVNGVKTNVTVTPTFSLQTPVEVVTHQSSGQASAAQSLWLHMNSLMNITIPQEERDNYTGPFFINGTTNLQAGEPLSLELSSTCTIPACTEEGRPGTIGCCGFNQYYDGNTIVQNNATGVNTWSFLVNTSPDIITIYEMNGKVDNVNGIAVSVVHGNQTDEDYVTAQGLFFMKLQGVP